MSRRTTRRTETHSHAKHQHSRSRADESSTEPRDASERGRIDRRHCPECDGRLRTDRSRGEVACEQCGLVVDETILDRRPSRQSDPTDCQRFGSPTTPQYHDDGLATVIAASDRDAQNKRLQPRKRRRVERLRTWNRRFMTRQPAERSLQFGLGELGRMAAALELSDSLRETASVIFRQAQDAEVHLGRSVEATVTASLFAAARQAGVPLTMDEVTAPSRVSRAAFERAYRNLITELSLEIGPPDPSNHVTRFASELSVSERVQRRATAVLDAAKAQGYHVGKHPAGIAASAIYAGCLLEDADVTQADIAAVADISTMTIRTHYQELLDAWRDPA
ncbi:transcription initiation factor IIB [Halorientalis pallida]|uniref:transcription initiation factor IIB n=1 Tax=Halorientalis pallida TaxID=2479928 RepID=UPI003C6FF8B3